MISTTIRKLWMDFLLKTDEIASEATHNQLPLGWSNLIWKSGSHPPSLFEDLDLEVTDLEVPDSGTGFPPKAEIFWKLTNKSHLEVRF